MALPTSLRNAFCSCASAFSHRCFWIFRSAARSGEKFNWAMHISVVKNNRLPMAKLLIKTRVLNCCKTTNLIQPCSTKPEAL